MKSVLKSIVFSLLLMMVSCGPSKYTLALEKANEEFDTYLKNNNVTAEPTNSGLVVVITKTGEGQPPQSGKRVAVQYVAKRLDGYVFDSTYEKGHPLMFKTGRNEVIKGLEEGVMSMNKGAKAILYIPNYLAYGGLEMKDIPQYSALVFEVELVDYEK